MMVRAIGLVFIPLFAKLALTLHLPPYVKTCSRNDPKLNECFRKNGMDAIAHFIHGEPKFGVPELDPFTIPKLELRQGTEQVGLNFVMTNLKLYGLGNVNFTEARVDLKNRTAVWFFKAKKGLQMIGPYKASGKVLLLPITGDGMANVNLTDITFVFKFEYGLVKKNGKEYAQTRNSNLDFDIQGATFRLENLFNGDKTLGDNMNHFLNENWRDLIKEFGPAVGNSLHQVFDRLWAGLVGLVPYDEVFPNTKV